MTDSHRRRIALIGPAAPFRGGIAQFTETIGRELKARRHNVYIATFKRQYPDFLFPGTTQHEPNQSVSGTADRLIDSINPITWLQTAKEVARRDPDAVIFQYWTPYFAPSYATIAGRLKSRSIPILSVVHNVVPHERRPGDDRMGRYFLKKCDSFLSLSDAVADDLRALDVEGDIRTVAHPVYQHFGDPIDRGEARRRIGVSEDAEMLLFFGFIRKYKGLHTLLEAMPRIIARRPRIRLVVAGEFYEDDAPYREAIRALGISEHVDVRPEYVPGGDVKLYFSAANLIVQPYESATQSGVVQTAYNFGRPVVVTDVGGLAEVVPDGKAGYVVSPGEPDALAEAVARYFAEGKEAEFTDGVREARKKYSWDALLDALEEMVERTRAAHDSQL